MEEYKLLLAALGKRLEQLINLHREAEERSTQLLEEQKKLNQQVEVLQAENNSLKKQNEALKIVSKVEGQSEDREELKKRVGELIKEVDSCIALLNK